MKTENGYIAPTININGSDGQSLFDMNVAAVSAVQGAALQIRSCMPHGRDYQTTVPNELDAARAQYEAWLMMLATIMTELTEVTLAIQDQNMERSRTRK